MEETEYVESIQAWLNTVAARYDAFTPENKEYILSASPELLLAEMVGALGYFLAAQNMEERFVHSTTISTLSYFMFKRFVLDEVRAKLKEESAGLPSQEDIDNMLKEMGLL